MRRYFVIFSCLFLIGISSFLLYHQKNIKCVFIASNKDFIAIKENIFVSKNTPLTIQQELLTLLNYAQNTLQNFWKMPIEIPTIIYCHSSENFQKLGAENTLALCRLGEYLVISSNGLDHEILTHEMCHAIVFDLLDENYLTYYTKLPSWLDEGIALQFNVTGNYANEELKKYKNPNVNELKYLDRPRYFYTQDHQITLKNYKLAKIEVTQFLENHEVEELKKLLIKISSKKKFYQTYERLNP